MSNRVVEKRILLRRQLPAGAAPPSKTEAALPARYSYLLSPAQSKGARAQMLFHPESQFDLAQRLRTVGITLGEAFSFVSPLYFRAKLAYASAFSRPSNGVPGTLVITPSRGLLPPEMIVTLAEFRAITSENITAHNPAYRDPLERDLRALAEKASADVRVVLLGSIATHKYLSLLLRVFGKRVLVPSKFIGLGNMSRGALLLQCLREGRELEYVPAAEIAESSRLR
ncbi:MAG TPA: hypothetical protein VMU53_17260 [Candidatus Sulfotelmatobacter sp.]|nr:hypothetical protein [Candidatus Sulfotelmatobacter sp.]